MVESMSTLFLSKTEVSSLLSFETAYAASEEAFRLVGTGKMTVTHNASVFTDSSHDNLFGSMCVHWPGKKIMGIKWFNMFSRQQQGYPAMNGHVIILSNTENGAPLAALAGTPITDYRTAAGHGTVAAKTLAREDASALAIIGCGSQGAIGLSSIASVLPIRNIFLWSRNPEKARELAKRAAKEHPSVTVSVTDTPAQAARQADVILMATSAHTPLLYGKDIPPGCTVIGLYSFNDLAADLASELDLWLLGNEAADRRSILENPLLLERGAVPDASFVSGDLSSVLCGRLPGRTSSSQRILYTHMGMAALDVTLAARVYEAAVSRGLGVRLHF